MKALSLTEPWALFAVAGIKTIETRSWNTAYRGRLAIHASATFPLWARQLCWQEPFKALLDTIGHWAAPRSTTLPLGAIVGAVDLIEVRRITPDLIARTERALGPTEIALGDWREGRFAWLLANPTKLEQPVPWTGMLGLWDLPNDRIPELA